jgi:hypothetical protein
LTEARHTDLEELKFLRAKRSEGLAGSAAGGANARILHRTLPSSIGSGAWLISITSLSSNVNGGS